MVKKQHAPERGALPDRWDGDVWAQGKPILPKPGPKIDIHWGDLLVLEKHLRDIQDGLRDVIKADKQDNPVRDGADYTDVHFNASTTLDRAVWLEMQVRGLRTGHWPDEEHIGMGQASPANPAMSQSSQEDDSDTPF